MVHIVYFLSPHLLYAKMSAILHLRFVVGLFYHDHHNTLRMRMRGGGRSRRTIIRSSWEIYVDNILLYYMYAKLLAFFIADLYTPSSMSWVRRGQMYEWTISTENLWIWHVCFALLFSWLVCAHLKVFHFGEDNKEEETFFCGKKAKQENDPTFHTCETTINNEAEKILCTH